MKRSRWSAFAGASLGVVAFALAVPGTASAQGYGSSGGSSGSSHGSLFAGHGSSGGGGSHGSLFKGHGSSGGGGSHGSLFAGHGSSGGGGSHGSMFKGHGSSGGGGSHGSMFKGHGSSGGGSSGGYAAGSYSPVPSVQGVYSSNDVVPTLAAPAASNVAYLNINVPEDAKVYLQDQLMTLPGTQRRFVTPQIQAGNQHVYTVKVEVVRNGQTLSKTTQAVVAAGQEIAVSVGFEGQNQELVASVGLLASN